jgi:Holliday junction resolvase RusA-like endonuclease
MHIKIINSNCDFKNPYAVEELSDSSIEIQLEFDRIISTQSKKVLLDNLTSQIRIELQNFEWLICGKVQLEIHWFLNSVERQETDKVGDLDNITKPLIDALCGISGVLIDDSQINSIHATWVTKSSEHSENFLRLILHFINDWTVIKKDLYFLQTNQAIYTPLNFDINNVESLTGIKLFIEAWKLKRNAASVFKSLGTNADRFLIYSEYEFHRTRLSGFDNKIILSNNDFENLCAKKGVNISA